MRDFNQFYEEKINCADSLMLMNRENQTCEFMGLMN